MIDMPTGKAGKVFGQLREAYGAIGYLIEILLIVLVEHKFKFIYLGVIEIFNYE